MRKTLPARSTLALAAVVSAVAVAFAAVAGLASAGTKAPNAGKVTIGLVSHNAASPGIKLYADAFKAAAAKRGWTVNYVDTQGDTVAALGQIKQWINRKVNAIVVDTIPNEALKEGIKMANDAHIPWFSVSSGWVPGVTNEIGANDVASGAQTAMFLVNQLGRKGNLIKVNWLALQALRDRDHAFDAVVKDMAGIKVVKTINLKVPGWQDDSYQQVKNYLLSNKDVQGIWLGWDDFAPDVVRAIKDAGLAGKVKVVGHDLDQAAADLLRKKGNDFIGSNALNIPAFAVRQVQLLADVFAGKTVQNIEYVPNCLATQDNIPAAGGRENASFWKACYSQPLSLVK